MPSSPITSPGLLIGNLPEMADPDAVKLRKLQARNRRVRAHEKAHNLAGGRHISGAVRYTYETGPDGKRYATGGQAHGTAGGSTPGDAIDKAQALRRAAAAPTRPSTHDRIAMTTSFVVEQRARSEMAQAEQTQRLSAQIQGGSAIISVKA